MPNLLPASNLGKIVAAWLVMLLVSIANGAARDFSYGRQMSELTAHQLSTASGIILLGFVIRVFCVLVPPASGRDALAIGCFWATLTVAFEFLFFHYLGGHSWSELLANYEIWNGRLWVFLLLWIAVAPYFFFRRSQ